jgi:hypothetical protein
MYDRYNSCALNLGVSLSANETIYGLQLLIAMVHAWFVVQTSNCLGGYPNNDWNTMQSAMLNLPLARALSLLSLSLSLSLPSSIGIPHPTSFPIPMPQNFARFACIDQFQIEA